MSTVLIILGMLSILYGLFVRLAGSGTFFWLIWELAGAVFFLWAFWVKTDFFSLHKGFRTGFGCLAAAGAILLCVLCGLIASEFSAKGEENLDYLIVLGAQVREDGPSMVLKYRLDQAAEYLQENPKTVCIVSGGQGGNEPEAEAEVMFRYLINAGIDAERVLVENQSENTDENISYSKALLKEHGTIGIVTNDFHMYRALRIAKRQGMEDCCGIAAESNPLYLPNNVLRECLALLKEFLFR